MGNDPAIRRSSGGSARAGAGPAAAALGGRLGRVQALEQHVVLQVDVLHQVLAQGLQAGQQGAPGVAGPARHGQAVGQAHHLRQGLAVPEAAVQFEGQQASVFLVAKGEKGQVARRTNITTGLTADGFVEIRDRFKDVIISGGENISSVEVEGVLMRHPSVQEVGVVGMPHEKWGEAPHAFVVLKPGASATEAELIAFVRERLAHFKAPHHVAFIAELPKTATGKIQKFVLRDTVRGGLSG